VEVVRFFDKGFAFTDRIMGEKCVEAKQEQGLMNRAIHWLMRGE